MNSNDVLVQVEGLKLHFPITEGVLFQREVGAVKAVDGLDFFIRRGETLGLVGESGCGKSTAGRAILQLYRPTDGKVVFQGTDVCCLNDAQLRPLRRKMQMIFQDPYASLNPRMTIGEIVGEPLDIHKIAKGTEKKERVQKVLNEVGLPYFSNRYPHAFSGGQRQRIGIARALIIEPEFIILDEPIAALDVSIQAQIVNLLEDLQDRFGLTYLFIAHDLSVVRHISDRVAVMYLGKLVELAGHSELYKNALHPYTKALLSAVPVPDPDFEAEREALILSGDVPTPVNPPSGCRFRTRCPIAIEECTQVEPVWREVESDHWVACHRVN